MKFHLQESRIKSLSVHLLWALLLVGSVNIAVSAHVGLNGFNTWRQADVYSQILGFMRQENLSGMEDFLGRVIFLDVPLYPHIVAFFSSRFSSDPLVTARVFNIMLWIPLIIFSYRLIERQQEGSGKYVAALLTASPLYIHYFSTPLPDNMSLSLAVVAVYLHIEHRHNIALLCVSTALIAIASLIKSPVAFVPVVFYLSHIIVRDVRQIYSFNTLIFFAASAACAVIAEMMRSSFLGVSVDGFAQDPRWYFGTLDLRLSGSFYETILYRTFGESFPRYSIGLAAGFVGLALLGFSVMRQASTLKIVSPYLIAFASGWLIFANVYYLHDYYQLPANLFFLMAISILFARGERELAFVPNWLPLIVILVLTPVAVLKGSPKRELTITSVFDAMSFILAPVDRLLYVMEPFYPGEVYNPEMGGRLRVRLDIVTRAEFEKDCDAHIRSHQAVLIRGDIVCAQNLTSAYASRFLSQAAVREVHSGRELGPFHLFYDRR